jgi:hypothetical protein
MTHPSSSQSTTAEHSRARTGRPSDQPPSADNTHGDASTSERGGHPAERHKHDNPESLNALLDRIQELAHRQDEVSVGNVMDALEAKSFAPWLLIPGLFLVPPGPADVPGVSPAVGLLVGIISVQMLMRRDYFWIPQWMERGHVASDKLDYVVGWLRKPAAFMDAWTKPRLEKFVTNGGKYVIAALCLGLGALTPLMTMIPFVSNVGGAAFAVFGLALLSRDGLLAIVAIMISVTALGLIGYGLWG